MLFTYTGLFSELNHEFKDAIHKLTMRRYLADIYKEGEYFTSRGLVDGTAEYSQCKALLHACALSELTTLEAHTDLGVFSIFVNTPSGLEALFAGRCLPGKTHNLIIDTIGQETSTIATHQFYEGLHYQSTDDFTPHKVTESEVYELCRVAGIEPARLTSLAQAGLITKDEVLYIKRRCLIELEAGVGIILSKYTPDYKALIYCTRPTFSSLIQRSGMQIQPLFLNGVTIPERVKQVLVYQQLFLHADEDLRNHVPSYRCGEERQAIKTLATSKALTKVRFPLPYVMPRDKSDIGSNTPLVYKKLITQIDTEIAALGINIERHGLPLVNDW